ncbi:hypothetical protein [Amycolatopsis sp. cmx-11-12]|uniref:hypothetical protein n=1 Tax=Amycolatopsis sp. cmx-11-12 TaxID=2785795 RepID=UPI003917E90B
MTTGEERLRQTYRALGLLIKQVEVAFIKRKADLRAFQGTREDYRETASEYEAWKSRTVHFTNCARERRGELEPRIRLLNEARVIDEMRSALRTLAQAVADHRDGIRNSSRVETTADRMLWVQLDLLPRTSVCRSTGSAGTASRER